jgi:hypothetical protein
MGQAIILPYSMLTFSQKTNELLDFAADLEGQ